jgi:hypothetical protein
MFPFTLGAVVITTVILTAFLVLKRRRHRDKAARKWAWLQQHRTAIVATVTEIEYKQAWRDGERWQRNPWSGHLEREKTWQSYYDVTAKWLHPATRRVYTFHWQIWADEKIRPPSRGEQQRMLLDLRQPEHYALDLPTSEESSFRARERLCSVNGDSAERVGQQF